MRIRWLGALAALSVASSVCGIAQFPKRSQDSNAEYIAGKIFANPRATIVERYLGNPIIFGRQTVLFSNGILALTEPDPFTLDVLKRGLLHPGMFQKSCTYRDGKAALAMSTMSQLNETAPNPNQLRCVFYVRVNDRTGRALRYEVYFIEFTNARRRAGDLQFLEGAYVSFFLLGKVEV